MATGARRPALKTGEFKPNQTGRLPNRVQKHGQKKDASLHRETHSRQVGRSQGTPKHAKPASATPPLNKTTDQLHLKENGARTF